MFLFRIHLIAPRHFNEFIAFKFLFATIFEYFLKAPLLMSSMTWKPAKGDSDTAQLVVAVVFGALSIISVILRIISRRLSRVSLGLDDYMIIVALVSTICGTGAIIASVTHGGSGKHQEQLSEQQINTYWKSMFVLVTTWPITQTAIKISILLFYVQLFVTRSFRIWAYTTMVIVCLWCIEQVIANLLICKPISFNWNFKQKGSCGNVMTNCLAGASINVLTDLIILALPMPIIWNRLDIPLKSKLSLSFIFGLGSLICIVSIIRLRGLIYWTTHDGTYKNSMAVLWTGLESTLGIICACIVVMRPLFGKLFPKQHAKEITKLSSDPPLSSGSRQSWTPVWMRSQKNARRVGANGTESQEELGPGRFQRLEENAYHLGARGQARTKNTTTIEVGSTGGLDTRVSEIEIAYPKRSLSPGAIMVKREWDVDSRIV